MKFQTLCCCVLACLALASAARPRDNDTGTLSFIVLGDWGGSSKAPYTTQGELDVAAQMAQTAVANGTQFVLAVGDNFYSYGVEKSNSNRFKTTFEDVFTADSLTSIPWYVIAGNHDHYGNVDAQIEYSEQSSRWNFPSKYYTIEKNATNSDGTWTALFVFIDTYDIDQNGDPDQISWIKSTLDGADKYDWVFMMGHYAVWSVAEHGSISSLQTHIKPLLEQYQVGAYMGGHDHDLQHIHLDNSSTDFFVSGAGHSYEFNQDHMDTVPDGALKFYAPPNDSPDATGGFITVSVDANTMYVDYIDSLGNTLYSTSHDNPRKSLRANRVAIA